MKWNGRSYRPINQISIKKKEFNMEEALRPLGQKMHDTYWVMNVQKNPDVSPIPPSPTPTNTTTPTPTPSSTPVLVDCTWSGTNINWEYNTNDWNECQPVPVVSQTPTSTQTPTMTVTPTNTPTQTITPTETPTNTPTETPTNTPTQTITPTETPTNTPTETPTQTPTPSSTPPPLTGQTEAATYMSAVIAGGGTLDATMSGATNQLFNDLFVAGLWNKLYSFYPLLGGNSSGGQAVNGKTPGTRNMTWNGGLTFSTNGVVSNGTTGYGDTNSNNSSIGGLNDFHMSFYSRTNEQNDPTEFDMGANESPSRTQLNSRSTSNLLTGAANTDGAQGSFSNTDSRGLFTITRRSSTDTEFYRNSSSLGNSATASLGRPNLNIFICRRNYPTLPENATTRQYAFVTTGNALSDTEVTDLYNAIQTFQTTLSRQV